MTAGISVRFVERFPEPAFAELQREIFAPFEGHSAEFAAAVRAERLVGGRTDPSQWPPMVRFGAYSGDQLVGWTLGWFRRPESFYMANSGVRLAYRRRGVYSQLVGIIVEYARSHGAGVVQSQHSVLNTPVIMAKLKLGFCIAGTSFSDHTGLLVQLVHHGSKARADVFRDRAIPLAWTDDD